MLNINFKYLNVKTIIIFNVLKITLKISSIKMLSKFTPFTVNKWIHFTTTNI